METNDKKIKRHKRKRLSFLMSMQADWYLVLVFGISLIVYAIYSAQIRFESVSEAVASAQSRREGKATLVVPEATKIVEIFSERVSKVEEPVVIEPEE